MGNTKREHKERPAHISVGKSDGLFVSHNDENKRYSIILIDLRMRISIGS